MPKLKVRDTQIEQLSDAFSFFNATTEKLTEAYQVLDRKVAGMDLELEQKNKALQGKIAEVDHINSHLENILHSMVTSVIAVGLDKNITVINRGAEKLLKIRSDDFIGEKLKTILSLENLDVDMLFVEGVVDNEQEAVLISHDSQKIDVSLNCVIIKNSFGEEIGYLILIKDLRVIKGLQEKARRADRLVALGEMAARVAHEIRNPLGGIEGFASLLVRELKDDHKNRKLAAYVVDGAKSVNHIVSCLLDYARPVYVKKSCFCVQKAIYEVCDNTRRTADTDMNIDLLVDIKYQNNSQISADRILFQQVLWNLMTNSMHSINGYGQIKFEYDRRGCFESPDSSSALIYFKDSLVNPDSDYFSDYSDDFGSKEIPFWHVISVSDTGEGISVKDKDNIFYPFYTTKENGTGLGLSTVYKIIEEHGGKIGVCSQLGRGTCIYLYFPGRVLPLEDLL